MQEETVTSLELAVKHQLEKCPGRLGSEFPSCRFPLQDEMETSTKKKEKQTQERKRNKQKTILDIFSPL